ncbi:hypothetical protein Tco_1560280, partial [Tanacetum coccineum]
TPHNQGTWNEVTPVNIGNTHGEGKSSNHMFVLTRIPSTPRAAMSYPPDALKKRIEINMKKNLKSHALTMKEEMVKESNAKIAKMFAQYAQQLPAPPP